VQQRKVDMALENKIATVVGIARGEYMVVEQRSELVADWAGSLVDDSDRQMKSDGQVPWRVAILCQY
jgi:hypothetical protein